MKLFGLAPHAGYARLGFALALAAFGCCAVFPGGSTGRAGPRCAGRSATIVGTPGDDNLHGTGGRDVVNGLGGDDTINGRRGRDRLCGAGGADNLGGGPGADTLRGAKGNDDLDGGPDSDNCTQGAGKGDVVNCEADLSVNVVSPATAPAGNVTFTVTVKNHGPSTAAYELILDEDNHDLMCGSYPWEGTHARSALDDGEHRSHDYTATCVDEGDPGGQVWVDATVNGPPDPNPGNDHDRATTNVG